MRKKAITLAAIFIITLQIKGQNMALTTKQQALVTIAANEAKGNIEELKSSLNEGFEMGLTVSEAKEALSQLYAYTGFPRSLNALSALQKVISERKEACLRLEEGHEADPLPKDYDALKQGTIVQTKLVGGEPFNYTFAPQTDYYLKAHLFGDIFARNNLSFADREVVTVSAISALPGCEPQLVAHVSGARNMGVPDNALKEIPALLETKVGAEEADRLRDALATVFKETRNMKKESRDMKKEARDMKKETCDMKKETCDMKKETCNEAYAPVQTVDFSVWPKGEPNTAYSKYFIGNSYLAPLEGGMANVTFEPRCRNNWHIHHKQTQVLICVAGRGWYQEWGKDAVMMTPGTIIAIPAEVKHWHGAAKDSWFQHLTYHKDVKEGASNEWLESVSDDIYDLLK